MYKKLLLAAIAAGSFALTGCASDGASAGAEGGADVFGAPIYLRGEMNDWNAQPQYLVKKVSDGVYVATAELKVDWAPYKYKFADASWTPGTNFGYSSESAPGVYEWGGNPIVLNPSSKFEEVKITPPADGVYDIYLEKQGDKFITYAKDPQ